MEYSDVVLRGVKWRPRETLAVFSGYIWPESAFLSGLLAPQQKFQSSGAFKTPTPLVTHEENV